MNIMISTYFQKVILEGNAMIDEDKVALNNAKKGVIKKDNLNFDY